jgi:hypothetical protein
LAANVAKAAAAAAAASCSGSKGAKAYTPTDFRKNPTITQLLAEYRSNLANQLK